MMGVTFAAVGPMVAMANVQGGSDGARAIFGAIIGVIAMLTAPLMSRLLRFFPPVVTGTIITITIIGISLMRVGIGWAMGGPAPAAQGVDMVKLVAMVDASKLAQSAGAASAATGASAPMLKLAGPLPMLNNPGYGALDNPAIAAFVLLTILLLVRYGRSFLANIAVLLGIVAGCALAVALGKMGFEKVGEAAWFDLVTPFAFGLPTFDPVLLLTMTLVMIESLSMFLALSDITGKPQSLAELSAGLRTAGLIMMVPGLLPKMAARVESLPQFVLGGAGLVMFGMVAATGIRTLAQVDFKTDRNKLYTAAISMGAGMVRLVAPRWTQQLAHQIHPLLQSGILLTAVSAVLLNLHFSGDREDSAAVVNAAKAAQAH